MLGLVVLLLCRQSRSKCGLGLHWDRFISKQIKYMPNGSTTISPSEPQPRIISMLTLLFLVVPVVVTTSYGITSDDHVGIVTIVIVQPKAPPLKIQLVFRCVQLGEEPIKLNKTVASWHSEMILGNICNILTNFAWYEWPCVSRDTVLRYLDIRLARTV